MKLYSPATIRDIKERHGFRLSKSLGQNFITDKNVLDKIIEGADIGPEDLVIEIGPGIGVLTDEAAHLAAKVIAIEIDSNLIPILRETLEEHSNVEVINRDVLKTDLAELVQEARDKGEFRGEVKIIGNLPYYITTPIIMRILESSVPTSSITIMMQKEVADRIRSGPGSRTYGAISVAVQRYCQVEKVVDVPKEVFMPRPKVDSTVLNLILRDREDEEEIDENLFLTCVKNAFGQRRKTLLNSLAGAGGMDKDKVRAVLQRAGIDPSRRAETLTIDEFKAITREVANG